MNESKERQIFCQEILRLATELGCTNAQYFYHANREQLVETEYGELSNQINSFTQSLALRLEYNGKIGAASTELFVEPETFVKRAIANAAVYEKKEPAFFLPPQEYPDVRIPEDPIAKWSIAAKIDFSLQVEKFIKSLHPSVQKVNRTWLSSRSTLNETGNTNGLLVKDERSFSYFGIAIIAEQAAEMLQGYGLILGSDIDQWQEKVQQTVQKTVAALGAKSLNAGKYPVVFTAKTFSELFSVFASAFSAKNVIEGKSYYTRSLGERVAVPQFTLVDSPFNTYFPVRSDDEGAAARNTTVIEQGVLKTFLHNSETAKQMQTITTGNAAYRGGQMFVAAHSWHVLPQVDGGTEADLCKNLSGKGILIESLAGMHAGANPVTGDFSLLATGYLYENGQAVRPINQFTIAGNFFAMLQKIERLGAVVEYHFAGDGLIAMPPIQVAELVIAGAENEC